MSEINSIWISETSFEFEINIFEINKMNVSGIHCKKYLQWKTENSLNKTTKIEYSKLCGISVEPCLERNLSSFLNVLEKLKQY